jgi:hypothetical protein
VRVQLHWFTVELAFQDLPVFVSPRSWPAKSFLSPGHSEFHTKLMLLIDRANFLEAAMFEQEDSMSSSNLTYALCKTPLPSYQIEAISDNKLQLRTSSMGRTTNEEAKRAHEARTRMANRHSRDCSSQQTLLEELRMPSNLEVRSWFSASFSPGLTPNTDLVYSNLFGCLSARDAT